MEGGQRGLRDRIFVNNVDGYLAGAICADLYKSGARIVGTRKSRGDTLFPPFVRIIPRLELRKLLKQVASSDVVIYDLHDADFEEIELVVRTLHTSEINHNLTFILISSVGVWARTRREYEGTDFLEEEQVAAEGSAQNSSSADATGDAAASAEQAAAATTQATPADGQAPAEGGETAAAETVSAEQETPPQPLPLRSEDYTRRTPAPKFLEWKAIESQVLALKEKVVVERDDRRQEAVKVLTKVRPHVVCAGVPYGNGEEPFLGLFKASWQGRDTLRVIGDGSNCIPTVHVRDVARVVRHILEGVAPSIPYHLAVDRGQSTQREIVQAVSSEYGLGSEIKSVSVAEAVLAELADILTLNLKMVPCDLMEVPYVEEEEPKENEAPPNDGGSTAGGEAGYPPATDGVPVEPAEEEEKKRRSKTISSMGDVPMPFRWWCAQGLPANVGKVAAEFSKWRRLQPVKILLVGPPASGADMLAERLAIRYNLPHLGLDAQIERLKKKEDSAIGPKLIEECDKLTAALANPKAPGPFVLPTAILLPAFDEATTDKGLTFRGYVSTGFPSSAEELEYFLMDAPLPPAPPLEEGAAESGEAASAADAAASAEPGKILDPKRAPDIVVVVRNSEEACQQRALEEMGMNEKEFKARLEKWKKENPEEGPGFAELIRDRFQLEPVLIDMEQASLGAAENQIAADLEARRQIFNFMLPPEVKDDSGAAEDAANEENKKAAQNEEKRRREAEEKRKKEKEASEKLENIKKIELKLLDDCSAPLRSYLTSLVVPTLKDGLIEVCREVPEDPVGYLSEYLAVNAQLAKQRAKNKTRVRTEPE